MPLTRDYVRKVEHVPMLCVSVIIRLIDPYVPAFDVHYRFNPLKLELLQHK